ncbi:hypothetical protein D0Z07_7865 [Hyphodiscus hymeniophilus]|uniref:Uncharacterized protein n=1 Tax=Hyphodiscus hymeniophilus TaxID=353542 RepID=A0A9P6SN95_9HELO|nr:hypothetical protein D0Z07_7865 [Hyphodiscus hymeniophilus]
MVRRRPMNHSVLVIRSTVTSTSTTPASSNFPSAYPSEDESEIAALKKPFPFLSLPSELRNKVYSLVFASAPEIIDLDPDTFSHINRQRLFALFRVSRQLSHESIHHFFSTHTFRLFPIYPGRYFKTKRPLLCRLPAKYRSSITSLDLRLGPGWNNPPEGWVVNQALGLVDCVNVRALKVFVECDTSDDMYEGYRKFDGFYELFCAELLESVLKAVPTIQVVELDAWSAVKRNGKMISGLGEVISKFEKVVAWGPERGWNQESDQVWLDALLLHRAGKLTKNAVVFPRRDTLVHKEAQ